MVSILFASEAPQDRGDVQLDSPKTIADLDILGNAGLIKYQDISDGLYSFFSDGDSSYICNSLISQG